MRHLFLVLPDGFRDSLYALVADLWAQHINYRIGERGCGST
jgi:hypothetical protein